MSIFSKAKSAAKSALSSLKDVFSNAVSKFTGSFSQTANAINAFASGKPQTTASSSPSILSSATGKDAGGTTYYNNYIPNNSTNLGYQSISKGTTQLGPTAPVYGPIQPTNISSGTATSNNNSVPRSRSSSNYSSPSYGPVLAEGNLAFSPASATISSGTLTGSSNRSFAAPSAPSNQNYQGTAIGGNVGVGADPSTGYFPSANASGIPSQDNLQGNQSNKSSLQTYLESLKQKASSEDAYVKAQRDSGIMAARQQMQNTQNSINAITTQMNTDLLRLRGTAQKEGVVEAVYGGQQQEITREATIKLLPLQAQLASDQGNLEMAQSQLDTLYKIYEKDANNSVDYWNDQARTIYDYVSKSEQRQLDEISNQKEFERGLIKDSVRSQQNIAEQALKDGNIRLYKAITAIQPPTNINSSTFNRDKQNYINDINEAISSYQPQSQPTNSVDAQLYSGLNGSTATAVRQQVGAFKTEPLVQNFATVQEGRNFVKSLPTTTKNPADDQALIYSLAKALDPGSVVREGEYATVQKYAQSWIQAYGKKVTQAINGTGFLSEEARSNIKKTIETKYQSSERSYDNLFNQYKSGINNLTGRNDGEKFLRDYKIENQTSGSSSVKIKLPDGRTGTIPASNLDAALKAGAKQI